MKRLDEISFTEAQAMQYYASLKAASYANMALNGQPSPEAPIWRAYADELENSLEAKIRFALGK